MAGFDLSNLSYHMQIFNTFTNIATGFAIALALLAMAIIFRHTSRFMKTYKYLLLVYIGVQIIFNIYSMLFKLIFMLPYPIIIAITPFDKTNIPLMSTLTVFEFVCILWNADLLLCMFIERYYSMTKLAIKHSLTSQLITYFGIAGTNIMVTLTYIAAQIPGGHLRFGDSAKSYISKNMQEAEKLLQLPYPMVDTVFAEITPFGIPFFVAVTLFIVSRGIGYLYYSYLNISTLKTLKTNKNPTLRKLNANAVKNLLIQLILLMTIGFIPPSMSLLLMATQMLTYKVYIYLQCTFYVYSVLDILCTLVIIRPYRNAIIGFLPLCLRQNFKNGPNGIHSTSEVKYKSRRNTINSKPTF